MKASQVSGLFHLKVFITLRDGWEWVTPYAVNSLSKKRGPKDRLPVEWPLDFGGCGSQMILSEQFRKIDDVDAILPALPSLFGEVCALSDGEEAF